MNIIKYPDERLTIPSEPVKFDDDLPRICDELLHALKSTNALGVAAVQIGIPKQVFVALLNDPSVTYFINPQIIRRDGYSDNMEGCLSIPGESFLVRRRSTIVVKNYYNNGNVNIGTFTGLSARIIQHEMEHLQGITLYTSTAVIKNKKDLPALGSKPSDFVTHAASTVKNPRLL